MAQYGAYTYESTESRALKTITADSYNKDQAKNLIQLNQNSEYMAQYLRKLQKGVDEANENIIEQLTGFVNDIIVLIGGGNATGLDLGDLKYIFQAIGALFGFDSESGIASIFPINLFAAAWHFFSTYLFPFSNFTDAIDSLFDLFISTIIEWFGDIPIIGEAVIQFASWLSDFRDDLTDFIEWVQEFVDQIFGFFSFEPSAPGEGTTIGDIITVGADFVARLLGIETSAERALTPYNPAITSIDGRVAVLESEGGSWKDNFNGRSSIGGNYEVVFGGGNFRLLYDSIGSNGSRCAALYEAETFTTSRNYAQWTIKIPLGYAGEIIGVTMSNINMTSWVGVKVYIGLFGIGSGATICTGTSYSSYTDRTVKFNRWWFNGDVIGLGYDPDTEVYVCYVNNEAVLAWEDDSPYVVDATDPGQRSAGFICGSGNTSPGAHIDEWAAYDWT